MYHCYWTHAWRFSAYTEFSLFCASSRGQTQHIRVNFSLENGAKKKHPPLSLSLFLWSHKIACGPQYWQSHLYDVKFFALYIDFETRVRTWLKVGDWTALSLDCVFIWTTTIAPELQPKQTVEPCCVISDISWYCGEIQNFREPEMLLVENCRNPSIWVMSLHNNVHVKKLTNLGRKEDRNLKRRYGANWI